MFSQIIKKAREKINDSESSMIKVLFEFMNILCIVLNALFFAVFIIIDVMPLAILSFCGIIVFICNTYLSYKERFVLATISTISEFSILILIATAFLGWNVGFYLYSVALIPIIFYCDFKYKYSKVIASIAISVVYFTSYILSINISPIYEITDTFQRLIFVFNSIISICSLIITIYIYSRFATIINKSLCKKNENLKLLANTDPLTGLCNRRNMFDELDRAKLRFDRENVNFCLILLDVDNFKYVNDDYGHTSGDVVLVEVSEIIKSTLRKDDIICRWGGEEILVLLNNTELESAISVAEKIRVNVCQKEIKFDELVINVTVTAGVCSSDDAATVGELIRVADKYLYKGKASGKNCVVSSK